jgi:hypothetical protein
VSGRREGNLWVKMLKYFSSFWHGFLVGIAVSVALLSVPAMTYVYLKKYYSKIKFISAAMVQPSGMPTARQATTFPYATFAATLPNSNGHIASFTKQ